MYRYVSARRRVICLPCQSAEFSALLRLCVSAGLSCTNAVFCTEGFSGFVCAVVFPDFSAFSDLADFSALSDFFPFAEDFAGFSVSAGFRFSMREYRHWHRVGYPAEVVYQPFPDRFAAFKDGFRCPLQARPFPSAAHGSAPASCGCFRSQTALSCPAFSETTSLSAELRAPCRSCGPGVSSL